VIECAESEEWGGEEREDKGRVSLVGGKGTSTTSDCIEELVSAVIHKMRIITWLR
jgi:hypothetical protein